VERTCFDRTKDQTVNGYPEQPEKEQSDWKGLIKKDQEDSPEHPEKQGTASKR
jgi:hypothetical protein